MPFREGPARVAFEIDLELGRLRSIVECDGYLHLPWPILSSVRNFSSIVPPAAVFQIVSETDVMTRGTGLAHENVDVEEPCRRPFCVGLGAMLIRFHVQVLQDPPGYRHAGSGLAQV